MAALLPVSDYVDGVRAGDRTVLARAITLIESQNPDHRRMAQELIQALLPSTGGAHRVGITGVPGVGKSTFIDQLGIDLTAAGHRVAVLAVDPTSSRTGGSILGDKTRMERLAVDPDAFVRPSPAGRSLGGVTRATRETILVCEAAGFDVVLVETVGVGQSETVVADMVDFFLVLMLSGAGDELQGIKKGVLELADMVAVNKADGDNRTRAELAAADYRAALHLMSPSSPTWTPPVVTCSGLTGVGLDELWHQVEVHREKLSATGELEARRRAQQVRWMWSMLDDRLRDDLRADPSIREVLSSVESRVHDGEIPATVAVEEIWDRYLRSRA
ncbi:methylmalonyl Co-A mutase-associated GTPase MeaB [Dermatobacter hominis]|uniref:methylmalonyl Co-A mutase-associated GTPase MeaB n=1 Tax=Dermatobacter hominis TaxID=2884263 RepID=UPI001D10BB40|nr:methylmalonyl Co-A mutase-associated GTPase MeaB [Dermatobacter hominis]UDY34274.1 methylmalonyl Co-A mutase-associated GTPase MeaB [Dermatobacter hominis]